MHERTIAIRVLDLGATASVRLRSDGRFVASNRSADVRFSGKLADLLRIARRQEDPDTLFFQRRLVVEGDTELGLNLKNLLDSIELPRWVS
ncbi:MAG: SCP2 sterol-binding domain-containing protein [Rhodocyclaceae bacterium]